MSMSSFRRTAVLLLVAAQGCMYIPASKGGRGIELASDRGRVGSSAQESRRTGFEPKTVTGKREPSRLIARDGSSCVVPQKRFQSTTLGTSAWCTWFDTDR
jgi:hypothetical protein